MPAGGIDRGGTDQGAPSRHLGVAGTDPLLDSHRPVFGGGVRHREGRAVDTQAQGVRFYGMKKDQKLLCVLLFGVE